MQLRKRQKRSGVKEAMLALPEYDNYEGGGLDAAKLAALDAHNTAINGSGGEFERQSTKVRKSKSRASDETRIEGLQQF